MVFVLNSILMGIGLAMDAFSVSVATSIVEWDMKKSRMCMIAGTFAIFQFIMPMAGWGLVHTASDRFAVFEKAIPYIALLLLLVIGINMIREAVREEETGEEITKQMLGAELVGAGLATSIDALSVGFTISDLGMAAAAGEAMIIGTITFALCMLGLALGRKLGNRVSEKAQIFGGVVLILIGIEIFVKGVFFS